MFSRLNENLGRPITRGGRDWCQYRKGWRHGGREAGFSSRLVDGGKWVCGDGRDTIVSTEMF